MKKLLFSILASAFFIYASGQTIQAGIRAGSQPNSVILSIKFSAAISQARLSSVSLAIGVPEGATPKPTATIKTNFNPNIDYTFLPSNGPENVPGKGNYNLYIYLGDGAQTVAAEKEYTAGGEYDLLEIVFDGGPIGSTHEVLLVNIPNGGETYQANFYISNRGADLTNQTAMFFSPNAVNGPGGYEGTSWAPLGNISLPVKFLSFFALKNGNDAKLSWTVENDGDNQYFELERSTNGRDFTAFAKVSALENGKSVNTYNSVDQQLQTLSSKSVYYRVKQVDKSGKTSYSAVRTVGVERNNVSVSIYPNPARSRTKVVYDAEKPGKGNILIRDQYGKLVSQVATQFVAGINQHELNVGSLPAGEYNVTVTGTGYQQTVKLTKIY